MYKKICPTCKQTSYSSCEAYQWDCPVCTTDLSLQKPAISGGEVLRGYPRKKQLSIIIKGLKVNQQA